MKPGADRHAAMSSGQSGLRRMAGFAAAPTTDLCLLVAAGDQEENAFVNPAEKK